MLNSKYFPLRATFYFLISFAVYLGILSFSNDQMNNGLSFLITSMAGVLSIAVLFRLLRDVIGPKVYLYALFFYFFRLSIGALHYLYFFDGQYFQTPLMVKQLQKWPERFENQVKIYQSIFKPSKDCAGLLNYNSQKLKEFLMCNSISLLNSLNSKL